MGVKEVPKTYQASDGKEFDNKADAERHDRIVTAQDKFDKAAEHLNRVLLESLKTADGQAFQIGRSYYHVWQRIYGEDITHESFYPNETKVDLEYHTPRVIRTRYEDRDGYKSHTFDLDDLFDSEKAAKTRLLEIRKARLADLK